MCKNIPSHRIKINSFRYDVNDKDTILYLSESCLHYFFDKLDLHNDITSINIIKLNGLQNQNLKCDCNCK